MYKNKVTSIINIGGLAIGMAVALMIGLWVQDELTYNRVHTNYDRLARVMINQTVSGKTYTNDAQAIPFGTSLKDDFETDFDGVSMASWNYQHILTFGNRQFLKDGMHVEPSFPKMFSLHFLSGTYENALNEPNAIVLSKSLANALFDNEDPIGKIIRFDAVSDMKVTAVFEDLPDNSEFKSVEYYVSWAYFLNQNEWAQSSVQRWDNHSFQIFAQLKENADITIVSQKIRDLEKPHNGGANPENFLFPMSDWHLYSDFENGVNIGGRTQYVWLFGLIGLFVLLLACINFMNLSTARSEKRAKEVGIRKTVGSMRGQLIMQFLSESLMATFLALILSVVMVFLSLNAFNEIADKAISIPWGNPALWVSLLAVAIFTGLVAGSYPAFYLSSFQPLKVLKGTIRLGKNASLPRKVMVTIQFTVSVALIIGTIVVFQQINYAKNRPLGYQQERVISFFSNYEIVEKYDVLKNEFMKTGAVEKMAYAASPITNIWSNSSNFNWEGKDPNIVSSFGNIGCSFEFGETINWEILEGRDFSTSYSTDTTALILNEAAVQQVGIQDIVGKTIKYQDKPHQVIGVVKNMIMQSPWSPIKPTIFRIDPEQVNVFTLKLMSGIPTQEALAKIEKVFKRHSPSSPFDFDFVDEEYASKFSDEVRIGKLARIFAFLAIFISCLGLFGLSAYVAEQRTKEIGIRKVLGATIANLWILQSKSFVVLVLLSCCVAIPLAWYYLDAWLTQYDYRIQLNWGVFVFAGFLALVITFITVSFQSVKAALKNPIGSLKNE